MSRASRPTSSKSSKGPISSIEARRREQSFKEYELILEELKQSFDERWKLNGEAAANDGRPSCQLGEFERQRTLGTGAFGRVMLVKHSSTSNYYAMKIMDKAKLVQMKQVEQTA